MSDPLDFSTLGTCKPGSAEWRRRFDLLMADESPSRWWWMVFTDPDKPKGGGRFLGLCLLPAPNVVVAGQMAWALGCNPGGQIESYLLARHPKPEYVGRLFTDPFAQEMADGKIDLWDDE